MYSNAFRLDSLKLSWHRPRRSNRQGLFDTLRLRRRALSDMHLAQAFGPWAAVAYQAYGVWLDLWHSHVTHVFGCHLSHRTGRTLLAADPLPGCHG